MASKATVPSATGSSSCSKPPEELLLMIDLGTKCLRHPVHGHSYTRFTAFRPHACKACGLTIWGVFAPACSCLNCGILVHRRCTLKLTITPCGSYRGLHDPEGCLSPPRGAMSPATAQTPPTSGRSTPFSMMRSRGPSFSPASRSASPAVQPGSSRGDGGRSPRRWSSPVPPISPGGVLSPPRRSTYETLTILPAVVGGLIGGFAGGPAGSLMAVKLGQATTIASSTFKVSGLLAGAYVGYNQGSRAGRGGSEEHVPASVWAGLAASVRSEREMGTSISSSMGGSKHKAPSVDGGAAARDEEGQSERIERLLADPSTLPGQLWQRCIVKFMSIHGGVLEEEDDGEEEEQQQQEQQQEIVTEQEPPQVAEGEEQAPLDAGASRVNGGASSVGEVAVPEEMEGGMAEAKLGGADETPADPATVIEDARAVVHELIVALLEVEPSWRSSRAAVERVMAAVEGVVLKALYHLVFDELMARTLASDQALEAWVLRGESEMHRGDREALRSDVRVAAAAEELRQLPLQATGPGKLQHVTRAVVALGQGDMSLTPDELLPLLVLAVRRAGVPCLHAELAYIEEFSDVRQLLGADGYAFTSLQAALQTIAPAPPRPPSRPLSVSPEPPFDVHTVDSSLLRPIFENTGAACAT